VFCLEKRHFARQKVGGAYCQKFTKRTIRLSREVMQSLSILGGFIDQTGYSPGLPGLASEL